MTAGLLLLDHHTTVTMNLGACDTLTVVSTFLSQRVDGQSSQTFWIDGKLHSVSSQVLVKTVKSFSMTGKIRNKLQIIMNGNGSLSIVHWNAGSRHWHRKRLDIELLIQELKPDLLFVSKANMFDLTPEWEHNIEGYNMLLPLSMKAAGYSWIVILVKEGTDVHLLTDLMEPDLLAIWVRISHK